jgi:hypothetical protein
MPFCSSEQKASEEEFMSRIHQLLLSLLWLSLVLVSVTAQTQPTQQGAVAKTNIIIERQLVRFTTQGEVQEWRLTVSNQSGEVVFDSGFLHASVLEWPLLNHQGEMVTGGLYIYTLTIKDPATGVDRTQRGHVILNRAGSESDQGWVTSTQPVGISAGNEATQLTVVGSRAATLGGAELPGSLPRRQTSEERGESPKRAGDEAVAKKAGASAVLSGTPNQIAKFADDGETLIDSIITETASGEIGIGTPTPSAGVKLEVNGNTHITTASGNRIQFGTPNSETGMSLRYPSVGRADLRFDGGKLTLATGGDTGPPAATNGLAITTGGNVGIGTSTPANRLDVNGGIRAFFNSSTGVVAQTTGGTNAWARFHMITPSQRWFMGTSNNFNSNQFYLWDETFNQARLTIQPNSGTIAFPVGNVSIGAATPAHRLSIGDGPFWTSNYWRGALELTNASALGWKPNAEGQSFGIGQTNGGLYFFHTLSAPGTAINQAVYDLRITDVGHIAQQRDKGGLVKALVYLNPDGTIGRCYNGVSGSSSSDCGFTSSRIHAGYYSIDFGFQIDDRFVFASALGNTGCVAGYSSINNLSGSSVNVGSGCAGEIVSYDGPVMVVVY